MEAQNNIDGEYLDLAGQFDGSVFTISQSFRLLYEGMVNQLAIITTKVETMEATMLTLSKRVEALEKRIKG